MTKGIGVAVVQMLADCLPHHVKQLLVCALSVNHKNLIRDPLPVCSRNCTHLPVRGCRHVVVLTSSDIAIAGLPAH